MQYHTKYLSSIEIVMVFMQYYFLTCLMNSADKPEKTGLSMPEHRPQMASNLSTGSPGFHASAWCAR